MKAQQAIPGLIAVGRQSRLEPWIYRRKFKAIHCVLCSREIESCRMRGYNPPKCPNKQNTAAITIRAVGRLDKGLRTTAMTGKSIGCPNIGAVSTTLVIPGIFSVPQSLPTRGFVQAEASEVKGVRLALSQANQHFTIATAKQGQ